MGGGSVKAKTFKKSELINFQSQTNFSPDLILSMHSHYSYYSNLKKDNGVLDYEEFLCMIDKEDNALTRKLFRAMDINKDFSVNFREFLKFISVFVSGSLEEQTKTSFFIFADEETKSITHESVYNILKVILREHHDVLDESTITFLLKNTFDIEDDNVINYDQFRKIVEKNPNILSWIKIDINKIKNFKN